MRNRALPRLTTLAALWTTVFLSAVLGPAAADVEKLATGQQIDRPLKRAMSAGVVIPVGDQSITFGANKVRAIQSDVFKLANEARRFQDPGAALRTWGDPYGINGAYTPHLIYFYASERSGLLNTLDREPWNRRDLMARTLAVHLWYDPPAAAPRRLNRFTILYTPRLTESEVTAWLGTPRSIKREKYEPPKILNRPAETTSALYYGGHDAAGIRVIVVYIDSTGLEIQLDPRP